MDYSGNAVLLQSHYDYIILIKIWIRDEFLTGGASKCFNKFYLLCNPRVGIGFYNFTQVCGDVTWNPSTGNLQRDSWRICSLHSELPVLALDSFIRRNVCWVGCVQGLIVTL